MKTITRIASITCTVFIAVLNAQNISFDAINSNNVLNLLPQILASPPESESQITILQFGNRNYAEANINKESEISVLQNGDYNYLNFNNSFDNASSKSVISAQGNNNIIDITGSNSISEKMQIHIKGDNKTIFVRNY